MDLLSTQVSKGSLVYSFFCGDLVPNWFGYVDNPCLLQLINRATRKQFLVRHQQLVVERPVFVNAVARCPYTCAFPPRLNNHNGYPRCFPLQVAIAPNRFSVLETVRLAQQSNTDTLETMIDYLQSCCPQLLTNPKSTTSFEDRSKSCNYLAEEDIVAVFCFPDQEGLAVQRWVDALMCFNEIVLDRGVQLELRHRSGHFVLYYTRYQNRHYQFHLRFVEMVTEAEFCVVSIDCSAAQRYSFLTFLLSFVRPASFDLCVTSNYAARSVTSTLSELFDAPRVVYQYTYVLQEECRYTLRKEMQSVRPFAMDEWSLVLNE
jgi:hypothetical protein